MEILTQTSHCYKNHEPERLLLQKKMDTDEEIVRWELVRVWTQMLEKYAKPGAYIPPVDEVRRDLIEKGVDAAVKAVAGEHWFVFTWMIRDELQGKVERGLSRFNLERFLQDVRIAQHNPGRLHQLREEIKNHVLFEDFN